MNTKNESLEGAYQEHKLKYSNFVPDAQSEAMLSFSFESGANWQKEKDKIVIDSLLNALKVSKIEIEAWRNGTNTRTGLKDMNVAKVGACFGGLPYIEEAIKQAEQ